jgi:hypothetical protein
MGNAAVVTAPAVDHEWEPSAADAQDLQGIVVSAYPSMLFAQSLMVRFVSKDPAAATDAKSWLTDITPRITYATGKLNPSVNIALSAAGLDAIGIHPEVLATFSIPFQQGMTFNTRAEFLGDVDHQDPAKWGMDRLRSRCAGSPRATAVVRGGQGHARSGCRVRDRKPEQVWPVPSRSGSRSRSTWARTGCGANTSGSLTVSRSRSWSTVRPFLLESAPCMRSPRERSYWGRSTPMASPHPDRWCRAQILQPLFSRTACKRAQKTSG